jgi:hypothetical protein
MWKLDKKRRNPYYIHHASVLHNIKTPILLGSVYVLSEGATNPVPPVPGRG